MRRQTTTERLLERYNSYSRRPTIRQEAARRPIFRSFQRTLGSWLPQDMSARILDIGCGEGALLSFLLGVGYRNLDGFDLSPQNVGICHELGLPWVRQLDALQMGEWACRSRWDVIFALDIIEHLPKQQVADFLEAVRGSLAPGGYVVIQTPNMGSLYGCYHRYYDLSHEFGLTEKTALDLMLLPGFAAGRIEVRAAWNGTTLLGRWRELHLRMMHYLVFAGEGASRPRVPTKNLLIRGFAE